MTKPRIVLNQIEWITATSTADGANDACFILHSRDAGSLSDVFDKLPGLIRRYEDPSKDTSPSSNEDILSERPVHKMQRRQHE